MPPITPEEQVTKNWVHEPERVAAQHAEKLQRILATAEIPGLVGGLALAYAGRRLGGYTGHALAAMGATMAVAAAGRAAYRFGPLRLRDWILEKLPPVVPARA